jgi:hypothetical protein
MKYYKDSENTVYAFDDTDGLPRYPGDDGYYRIPDTLTPITEAEADALRFPPPTSDQLEQRFKGAVSARISEFVAARGWDTLDRVLAQAGEFAGDREIAQAAYDAQWSAAFALLADVRSGEVSVEDALEQLPALPEWPA